jgi:adenosylcobinamide kinase/adenosylcobinamide-phosphate guanylyltransferase
MGGISLILGGARSGKSGFAQELAARLSATSAGSEVTYLATAAAGDEEMRLRITRHRQARPADWRTVEEPLHVARALAGETAAVVIIDCLTLLITNILLERGADRPGGSPGPEELEEAVMREMEELLQQCRRIPSEVLLISNEVGMSLVPPTPLGRTFRDIAGRVNQRMAREAEEVYFLVAGLPRRLK